MIKQLDGSSGNVLGYQISGTIKKDDYDEFVPAVEKAVDQDGSVALLLDMTEFKWEAVSAWGADIHFSHEFRKKISRMAIVGDKRWEKWLTKVAAPCHAEEAEYFTSAQSNDAWDWVRQT